MSDAAAEPCEQPLADLIRVENTRPEHFAGIRDLCRRVYPDTSPWGEKSLSSHLEHFPEGQFVAVRGDTGEVVGMAASLIVNWSDYDFEDSWRDFTDHGMFTNHDPDGRTLYGAEVMVDPTIQRCGIGSKIYAVRHALVERLELLRIRAGARLRGYRRHADEMTAEEYVRGVVKGDIQDPTLTFQINHGFVVVGVVEDYLGNDPASRGHAAIIEWVNKQVAREEDYRVPRWE